MLTAYLRERVCLLVLKSPLLSTVTPSLFASANVAHPLYRPASMNFAPYRDDVPSDGRESLLPTTANKGKSNEGSSAGGLTANITRKVPWFSSYQSGAAVSAIDGQSAGSQGAISGASNAQASSSSQYQHQSGSNDTSHNGMASAGPDAYVTRFSWRVDLEAALAYFLGPVLAILLLILESHNSFVRFHAYQSLLLSCALAVVHLLLIWSTFLTRTLFALDVVSFWGLSLLAFRDAETLQRRRLPSIGEFADRFVEEE